MSTLARPPIRIPLPTPRPLPPRIKVSYPRAMSIVVGFRTKHGILLCADTQYTAANKIFQEKIFPMEIGGDSYLFALAGNGQNGLMAIEECRDSIEELEPQQRTYKSVKRTLREASKKICDEYVL